MSKENNQKVSDNILSVVNDFHNRTIEEQVAFFMLMENMCENSDFQFIVQFINHENFDIRVSIQKILNVITTDETNIIKPTSNNKILSEKIDTIKPS